MTRGAARRQSIDPAEASRARRVHRGSAGRLFSTYGWTSAIADSDPRATPVRKRATPRPLVTAAALLNGRTGYRSVGTKHAAIADLRLKQRYAVLGCIRECQHPSGRLDAETDGIGLVCKQTRPPLVSLFHPLPPS